MNTQQQVNAPASVNPNSAALVSPGTAPTRISEFLSFKLGSEECGIDNLRVQEIRIL